MGKRGVYARWRLGCAACRCRIKTKHERQGTRDKTKASHVAERSKSSQANMLLLTSKACCLADCQATYPVRQKTCHAISSRASCHAVMESMLPCRQAKQAAMSSNKVTTCQAKHGSHTIKQSVLLLCLSSKAWQPCCLSSKACYQANLKRPVKKSKHLL